MQLIYRDEANNLKQQEDKMVEQLQDQMDTKKIKVMFNATEYFEIKWYVKEQPLTPMCQALLDKSKFVRGLWHTITNPKNPQLQQRPKP